ncbi:MAG: YtxH domain-containing protein [Saprospiraceae bacterium]|jgi:gas vesicle protein|nr:YtxH domain-containing protein [Saprospiraceae bacterium]
MKTRDVVLGVLGGLAVGMVAGILLAPDKGSETRKKLVNQGKDLKNDIKGSFDKWSDTVAESVDHLKAEAEDLIAQATRKYKEEKAKFEKAEEV